MSASLAPIVACQYCGRQYRNAPVAPLAPPPVYSSSPPAGSSSSPLKALLVVGAVGFVVMVASAIGVFFWVSGSSAARGGSYRPSPQFNGPTPPSGPDKVVTWNSDTPQFFASGAAVPNLLTFLVVGAGNVVLAGVSGATGKLLWQTPAGIGDLYTDEGARILRFDTGKTLTRYDAGTGKVSWTVRLADDLEALAFGPHCVALRITRVADVLSLDSDTGKPAPCTTSHPPVRENRGWGELPDQHGQHGDISYVGSIRSDSKPVNPDPPRLMITATRAGKQVWQNAPNTFEPVWETGGFDRSLAFTPTGIFLYGRTSADHLARWTLLDYASGKILYEGAEKSKVDTRIHVASRGSLAFVTHDFCMHAYNAATGAEVWALGQR
jgi:hypothetical protein